MFCENCGTINIEGSKFCESCGMPLTTNSAQISNTCKQCGSNIMEGANFCDICGSPVVGTQVAATTEFASPYYTPDAATANQGYVPNPTPMQQGYVPSATSMQAPPKKKTAMIIAIVIVAVISIGFGVTVFFLMNAQPRIYVPENSTSVASESTQTQGGDASDQESQDATQLPAKDSADSTTQPPDQSSTIPPSSITAPTDDDPALASQDPVYTAPKDVKVSVDDFSWYDNFSGINNLPAGAKYIENDPKALFGTWKGMILAKYGYELQPSTYSCDIGYPSDGNYDAAIYLYEKGYFGVDGWTEQDGELVATASCMSIGNSLSFKIQNISYTLVFWENGNKQYALFEYTEGSTPFTMMLVRDVK